MASSLRRVKLTQILLKIRKADVGALDVLDKHVSQDVEAFWRPAMEALLEILKRKPPNDDPAIKWPNDPTGGKIPFMAATLESLLGVVRLGRKIPAVWDEVRKAWRDIFSWMRFFMFWVDTAANSGALVTGTREDFSKQPITPVLMACSSLMCDIWRFGGWDVGSISAPGSREKADAKVLVELVGPTTFIAVLTRMWGCHSFYLGLDHDDRLSDSASMALKHIGDVSWVLSRLQWELGYGAVVDGEFHTLTEVTGIDLKSIPLRILELGLSVIRHNPERVPIGTLFAIDVAARLAVHSHTKEDNSKDLANKVLPTLVESFVQIVCVYKPIHDTRPFIATEPLGRALLTLKDQMVILICTRPLILGNVIIALRAGLLVAIRRILIMDEYVNCNGQDPGRGWNPEIFRNYPREERGCNTGGKYLAYSWPLSLCPQCHLLEVLDAFSAGMLCGHRSVYREITRARAQMKALDPGTVEDYSALNLAQWRLWNKFCDLERQLFSKRSEYKRVLRKTCCNKKCDGEFTFKQLKTCGGCRHVYYCSHTCQIIDWNSGHRDICDQYRSQTYKSPFKSIRFPLIPSPLDKDLSHWLKNECPDISKNEFDNASNHYFGIDSESGSVTSAPHNDDRNGHFSSVKANYTLLVISPRNQT